MVVSSAGVKARLIRPLDFVGMSACQDPLAGQHALTRSIWERLTTAAEQFKQPG